MVAGMRVLDSALWLIWRSWSRRPARASCMGKGGGAGGFGGLGVLHGHIWFGEGGGGPSFWRLPRTGLMSNT